MSAETIEKSLGDAMRASEWLVAHEGAHGTLGALAARLAASLARGGRVLTCGNGGSMCEAMHFAEELSGRFRRDRRALAALAMSDPGHLTCVANDYGFDQVFARGVEAWGRPGDVLLVFSTSGNSANVVAAAETARASGLEVVGLLGRDGGRLRPLCDACLVVPGETADRIQEVHMIAVHALIEAIEQTIFPA